MTDTGTYADVVNGATVSKNLQLQFGTALKAIGTRSDAYLDPSFHPPLGLLTSMRAPGVDLISLPNGNFEDGLAGWTVAAAGAGAAQVDATSAITGRNAIRFTVSASGDSATITSGFVPAGEGIPLYFSTRTRSVSGSPSGYAEVAFFDTNKAYLGVMTNIGGSLNFGSAYAEVGGWVVPPAGTRYVQAQVAANGSGGVFYVDQIRLNKSPLSMESRFLSAAAPPSLTRSVSSKLDDLRHVVDFGAIGDGGSHPLSTRYATAAAAVADYPFLSAFSSSTVLQKEIDFAALQAGLNWLVTNGGGRLHLGDRQLFVGTDTVTVTGLTGAIVSGDGIDKCKIIGSSASNDILFFNTSQYGTYYNHFEHFTVTSTVARTNGAHIHFTNEKHTQLFRIKVDSHFNGIQFDGFEQVTLSDCYIINPSGAGTALVIGTNSTTVTSGANFTINTALIRGNNDKGQNAAVGNYGIIVNDCDAVFAFNVDIGGVIYNDLLMQPSHRNANNFWNSCYFDATQGGDCVSWQGNGIKSEHTFNGCWFASAGMVVASGPVPPADAMGVRITSGGTYSDIKFVGCVFYNNSGCGLLVQTPQADIVLSGCTFSSNGKNSNNYKQQIWIAPSSTQYSPMVFSGLKFDGTNPGGFDIYADNNTFGNIIVGCMFMGGISQANTSLYAFKRVEGCDDTMSSSDLGTAYTITAATTLSLSPYKGWFEVGGTTTVTGILPTWIGHIVSLHAASGFTIRNQVQNIHLNGNDSNLPSGTVITLRCNHNYQWYEIGRTATAG